MSTDSRCPFCRANARILAVLLPNQQSQDAIAAQLYECPNCTQFIISYYDYKFLEAPESSVAASARIQRMALERDLTKMQSLLASWRLHRRPIPWIRFADIAYAPVAWQDGRNTPFSPIFFEELLSEWPSSILARMDKVLSNLARMSPRYGATVRLTYGSGGDRRKLLTDDADEARYCLDALQDKGWITTETSENDGVYVRLSPEGWDRIDEVGRALGGNRGNPAFVAMWFGDDSSAESPQIMSSLFMNAIRPACEAAGYRADRSDLEEHNEFVMDRVLALIRQAPFVVADLTGNRNGVYFEAGFARGLGIPVIQTCRHDHFASAHFDVKQINTIVWHTEADLKEKITNRIIVAIGRGQQVPQGA